MVVVGKQKHCATIYSGEVSLYSCHALVSTHDHFVIAKESVSKKELSSDGGDIPQTRFIAEI